jgi:hypothetical protein
MGIRKECEMSELVDKLEQAAKAVFNVAVISGIPADTGLGQCILNLEQARCRVQDLADELVEQEDKRRRRAAAADVDSVSVEELEAASAVLVRAVQEKLNAS